jgi:carbamoyltransferase
MRILGIASETHDTGIALAKDGIPEMVVEEERLNRQKKTMKFPSQSLNAAFAESGLDINDIECITMPWHIPTLLRTFSSLVFRRVPRSLNLINSRSRMSQRNQIIWGGPYLARKLKKHFHTDRLPPIIGIGHHDAHAASFFMSPFDEATILVMDGYGDDASTSVYTGRGNVLQRQWHTALLNSLGIVFTVITQYLGFQPNQDEGKVMGLAAYGEDTYADHFRKIISPTDDGRYRVDLSYFWYDSYGLIRPLKQKFLDLCGPPRRADEEITQRHRDIACGLQTATEEAILHIARNLLRTYPSRNLFLTGGVALNCIANARILSDTDYERIWIPPNASDTGATLGSALWHYHMNKKHPRRLTLRHAFYGKEYDDQDIIRSLNEMNMDYEQLGEDELIVKVARDIADGRIVGWFQGRFEMGPRALGNRSILADPRRAEMKDIINRRVKHREAFRPFAPAILREHVQEFFEIAQEDPFMTIAPKVKPDRAHLIPAVVHVDKTCRIQTIDRESNPRYYGLIKKFGELSGVPVLLNSSFNRQEPIVARPAEAVSCFLRTDMDVLVMGSYYVTDRNPRAVEKAFAIFKTR